MGSAHSTNVANIISNIMSKETSEVMARQVASGAQDQGISIIGGSGTLNIEGNKESQTMNINMDGLAKALSTQVSQQNIVQELTQAATSSVSGISFSNSDASNIMNDFLNVGLNVSSNIGQICEAAGRSSQSINVVDRDGEINIKGNVQEQVSNIIAKCVQDATSSNSAVQSVQTSLSQSATAKVVGLDLMQIIALILIILASIIIIPMVGVESIISKFLFPMIAMGGGVCLYYWSIDTTSEMAGVAYSTSIIKDKECYSGDKSVLKLDAPDELGWPAPDIAARQCQDNDKCMGFDWFSILKLAVFYSDLRNLDSNGMCPHVTADPKNKTLVRNAKLIVDSLAVNTPPDQSIGSNGDVFVDTVSGHYYWKYSSDAKNEGTWMDQDIISKDFKSGVSITSADKFPDASAGKDGDLFINTSDPNAWKLYIKVSGAWSSGDDKPLTGPTATQNKLSFPGRHSDVPPATDYDWSGFKIHKRKTVWLVLGIVLIVLGVGGTFISFSKSSQSTKNPSTTTTKNPSTTTSSSSSTTSSSSSSLSK